MIRGLVVIVQVLLWLLIIRVVLRGLAGLVSGARGGKGAPREAPRARPQVSAPEDLVLDRVCRTYVPRSGAIRARVGGGEEWFCSAACRDRALAAVARAS
jgi:hypothetical protein